MIFKRISIRLIIALSVFVSFFSSCTKDDTEPSNFYLVTYEPVVTYSKMSINSMIDLASAQYPQIASFKPYMVSDVKVYRIVYRTTIGGKDIEASGLVSVPANKGDYPVLSFQNGTNTLNINAPSVNP
ncbi:MAG: hypothetical protein HZB98_11200, partial [Bacteroidia bacterium]|nr:hypothetical protein [Bacteroidia bacterium]